MFALFDIFALVGVAEVRGSDMASMKLLVPDPVTHVSVRYATELRMLSRSAVIYFACLFRQRFCVSLLHLCIRSENCADNLKSSGFQPLPAN